MDDGDIIMHLDCAIVLATDKGFIGLADNLAEVKTEIDRLEQVNATLRCGLRAIEGTDDAGQSLAKYMRYEASQTLFLANSKEAPPCGS